MRRSRLVQGVRRRYPAFAKPVMVDTNPDWPEKWDEYLSFRQNDYRNLSLDSGV
jgi:hypothetical protein